MSKKLLLFPLFFMLISCYDQECNCESFQTGKFEFVQEVNGIKKTTIFERTEKLQIETFEGKTDTATVRWVNNCEFVLEKLHPKNMLEKKAITMRIFSTNKNSYTFEYSFVGSEKKENGTATKL